MDIFAATVPEECRAPLLERIYERDNDSSDTENPFKRPCSTRKTPISLASKQRELSQQVPNSPPPVEDDLSRYTYERVRAGLRYIDHTIATGDITPRTFTFLNLSKEAHGIALDCCEETPSEKAVAVVQQYDAVYASEAYLLHPRSAQELQRMGNLTKLRRLQILTNYYGDGVGPPPQESCADTWESTKAWSNQEAGAPERPLCTWLILAASLSSTTLSDFRQGIHLNCAVLGLNSTYMLTLIRQWADQNRECHDQLAEHIKECNWHSLAEQIHMNLQDLTNIEYGSSIVRLFQQTILGVRDRYFDLDGEMDPPGMWVRNEYARELGNRKREREREREAEIRP